MLLNIVFSYNRAMQLDCFLESFIKHYKATEYEIAIVYHTSGNHHSGYNLLLHKYSNYGNIKFYERAEVKFYFFKILPILLLYPRNLYRYAKYTYLRKKVDNFKFLVERIINSSNAKYLMFSTDDTIYDNDVVFVDSIFSRILESPINYSYRLFLGGNLIKKYNANVFIEQEIVTWDYYENQGNGPWGYVFTVDGTIYNKRIILESIAKLVYHMPATLESFTNTYLKKRKLLCFGFAPLMSCLSNIWINRVQILGDHESLNISVDYLNDKFLDNFKIKYKYHKPITEWGTIPEDVYFEKLNKT
jgi:hypothetical protein